MARKISIIAILLLTGLLVLVSCNTETSDAPDADFNLAEEGNEPPIQDEENDEMPYEGNGEMPEETENTAELPLFDEAGLQILYDPLFDVFRGGPVTLLQLTPLTPGEELAVLHTNMGDITLRFFPGEAPVAVENFTTHARNGFYDDGIFHRVIPGFMIQGGCPHGTGTGGESIWGGAFGLEPSFKLRHFRGALAMAHAGGAMGSQFYIVQNSSVSPEFRMEVEFLLEDQDIPIGVFPDGQRVHLGDLHPPESLEHFLEHGGTPHLDWFWNPQAHTVFGHVVDGMDVVDAIAAVSRGPGDRPEDDVIIERISFIIYE